MYDCFKTNFFALHADSKFFSHIAAESWRKRHSPTEVRPPAVNNYY